MRLAASGALAGASDDAGLTTLGRIVASFPGDLAAGKVAALGAVLGHAADAAILAAVLTVGDVFYTPYMGPVRPVAPELAAQLAVVTRARWAFGREPASADDGDDPLAGSSRYCWSDTIAARNAYVAWRAVPLPLRGVWSSRMGLNAKKMQTLHSVARDIASRLSRDVPGCAADMELLKDARPPRRIGVEGGRSSAAGGAGSGGADGKPPLLTPAALTPKRGAEAAAAATPDAGISTEEGGAGGDEGRHHPAWPPPGLLCADNHVLRCLLLAGATQNLIVGRAAESKGSSSSGIDGRRSALLSLSNANAIAAGLDSGYHQAALRARGSAALLEPLAAAAAPASRFGSPRPAAPAPSFDAPGDVPLCDLAQSLYHAGLPPRELESVALEGGGGKAAAAKKGGKGSGGDGNSKQQFVVSVAGGWSPTPAEERAALAAARRTGGSSGGGSSGGYVRASDLDAASAGMTALALGAVADDWARSPYATPLRLRPTAAAAPLGHAPPLGLIALKALSHRVLDKLSLPRVRPVRAAAAIAEQTGARAQVVGAAYAGEGGGRAPAGAAAGGPSNSLELFGPAFPGSVSWTVSDAAAGLCEWVERSNEHGRSLIHPFDAPRASSSQLASSRQWVRKVVSRRRKGARTPLSPASAASTSAPLACPSRPSTAACCPTQWRRGAAWLLSQAAAACLSVSGRASRSSRSRSSSSSASSRAGAAAPARGPTTLATAAPRGATCAPSPRARRCCGATPRRWRSHCSSSGAASTSCCSGPRCPWLLLR